MKMLPAEWCAVSTRKGYLKKNTQTKHTLKPLTQVPIFMQFIKLTGLMSVHCV